MDKLIPVQGVDHTTSGGKKLHDRVTFPDFSAFQMTIAGAATPRRTTHPGALEDSADSPAPDPVSGPGTAPGTDRGRLNAPPFSWLGSDAWPNFPLWADKPS
jgi:hypothetical protein